MQAGPTTRCLTFKGISVCNLKAIARSSLEETQTTREVMKYEGGEVVTLLPDGKRQLRPGKVKSVRLEIHTHPVLCQNSALLK